MNVFSLASKGRQAADWKRTGLLSEHDSDRHEKTRDTHSVGGGYLLGVRKIKRD